ncbi:hypothetical protein [Nocardia sp. NPDC004711]
MSDQTSDAIKQWNLAQDQELIDTLSDTLDIEAGLAEALHRGRTANSGHRTDDGREPTPGEAEQP